MRPAPTSSQAHHRMSTSQFLKDVFGAPAANDNEPTVALRALALPSKSGVARVSDFSDPAFDWRKAFGSFRAHLSSFHGRSAWTMFRYSLEERGVRVPEIFNEDECGDSEVARDLECAGGTSCAIPCESFQVGTVAPVKPATVGGSFEPAKLQCEPSGSTGTPKLCAFPGFRTLTCCAVAVILAAVPVFSVIAQMHLFRDTTTPRVLSCTLLDHRSELGPITLSDPRYDARPSQTPLQAGELWRSTLCWAAPGPSQTHTGSFSVEMELVLSRSLRSCDPGQPARHFSRSNWTQAAARVFGADELELGLDGPEILDVPQFAQDGCSYRFQWHITIPGAYRLYLAHHRDYFSAVEEIAQPGAGIVLEGFEYLPFPELLSGGTNAHPPGNGLVFYAYPSSHVGASDTPAVDFTESARVGVLNETGMAVCATTPLEGAASLVRMLALPGRFVRLLPPSADMFDSPGTVYRPSPGREWWTNGRADVAWRPYDCRLPHVTTADAQRCLSGRRLLMSGDSHMRVFFNYFISRLCEAPVTAEKGADREQCFGDLPACPGLVACLYVDELCGVPPPLSGADWLVLSCGQHFAANFRLPVEDYRVTLAGYLSQMHATIALAAHDAIVGGAASVAPPPPLVWVTTHTLPLRNDSFVRTYRDGRTHHRTRLLNMAARDVFASLHDTSGQRVTYVDVEASTQALSDLSFDEAHFENMPPVLDFHVDAVLAAMGCSGD